jgi:hypothetical protein
MRFVRGETLQEAARKLHAGAAGYTLRGLLTRFVAVCNAVAYAHSRGVIHRDLKPANVMLGPYGETLVLDWGLAKVVGRSAEPGPGERPAEGTLLVSGGDGSATRAGSLLGTPAYMSPEQADGRLEEQGPATDVYSLGATLYALLTGRPPVQGDTPEVLERVRQGNWPPPAAVQPAVPKALDAVCRKAMALKPADRYSSALHLAADVEAWLADEPVSAYREPGNVKAGRWLRRHRQMTTGVAAVLLAAVPLSIVIAVNSDRARRRAEQDERTIREQNAVAESNEKLAKENETSANDREAETRAVLDFVETKVLAAARPQNQAGGLGHEVSLRRAVEAALPFVGQSFQRQPLIEARLRMTLGLSFWYLGDWKIAADQFQAARAIYEEQVGHHHPDTLRAMLNLANQYSELGRQAEALKLREETLTLCKAELGTGHIYTLRSMVNLADSYGLLGRHAEALKLHEEARALCKAKLGADDPLTLNSMANLANNYFDLGRRAEALKLRDETLALRKAKLGADHPDTLRSMTFLAWSFADLGQHAEALKLVEETLALQKAKLGPHHPDTLWSMYNIACCQALMVPKAADRGKQADLAMESLRSAAAAGFKNLAKIKQDTDLDALRGREDFKKLLADLEASQAKGKK